VSTIVPPAELLSELKRRWWIPALIGVLSTVAGVIVLTKPENSLKTLAVIIGIFVLADGVIELLAAATAAVVNRGMVALLGVLNVIVGILLLRHPIQGVVLVAVLIGIWLLVLGVIRFAMAFEMQGSRGWQLFVAVIDVIVGIVIVSSPRIGFATLALIVGIGFIANGVALLMAGFSLRRLEPGP
jgi:uncharacterized membrane protein HdeD (DUF308 family)